MVEFADKGITTALITLFRYLKENMKSGEGNERLIKRTKWKIYWIILTEF